MDAEHVQPYIDANIERWKYIADSTPQRIVKVLRLRLPNSSNAHGDTYMDVFPAVDVVTLAAHTRGIQWQRLVRNGVMDALCQLFLDIPAFSEPRVGRRDTPANVPSSWYIPLRALNGGAAAIWDDPASTTSKIVMSVIKKKWVSMVDRVWNDLQHSCEDAHYQERTNFAVFVHRMVHADPTLLSIIDRDSDLTIPLLTKYWLRNAGIHITDPDFLSIGSTLAHLIDPSPTSGASLARYRRSHATNPSAARRILRGLDGSMTHFLNVTGLLVQSSGSTQSNSFVHILVIVICDAMREKPHPSAAFFTPILLHKDFWKFVLAALEKPFYDYGKKAGHSPSTNISSHHSHASTHKTPSTESSDTCDFFMNIFQLVSSVLQVGRENWPDETTGFVKLLVRADMFDTLDEVVPNLKSMPRIGDHERRLRSILNPQFPRSITLRALLDMAHAPSPSAFPHCNHSLSATSTGSSMNSSSILEASFPSSIDASTIGAPDSPARVWLTLSKLERRSKSYKECRKRGCEGKVKARCKDCGEAGYCGVECQKKDWKEHRLICGFKAVEACDIETVVYVTYPKRFLDDFTSIYRSHSTNDI